MELEVNIELGQCRMTNRIGYKSACWKESARRTTVMSALYKIGVPKKIQFWPHLLPVRKEWDHLNLYLRFLQPKPSTENLTKITWDGEGR